MPVAAGDLGFMTGLSLARREGTKQVQEWKVYSQGLSNQLAAVSQQLQEERVQRTYNRANVAGMTQAINALPPEIREIVKHSIAQHFGAGFVRRALELGLPQEAAVQAVETVRDATIKAILPGSGR